jgi:hypothetical protein
VSLKSKELLQRVWWRNILYYDGHQWIKWDRTRWRAKELDPRIPKPVTNKFASSADAITAALSKIVPLFTYVPTGRDPESKATASICHHITPIIYEEVGIEKLRGTLAMVAVLTGNAFLQSGYDPEDVTLGYAEYNVGKCPSCGVKYEPEDTMCPKCMVELELVTEKFPVGKCYTELCLPFEIFPNPYYQTIKRWLIKGKLYDPEWIKERFPEADLKDGEEIVSDHSLRYTAELKAISSALERGREAQVVEGTAVWEMWQEPDNEFPDGFFCSIVRGKVVEFIDHLPDRTVKGHGFIPFTRFGFKPRLGSFWHKSGVDDLAIKQKQRNELESLIQLIYMTMANPVWLKPDGCNVSKITGLPGDQITYSPLASAKPERLDGKPPHPVLINWINQIDKDFEELAATFDILRGEKPAGVRAGYALQVLTERALARYAPLYREWENSWEDWNRKQLEIFRTNATEARIAVMKTKTSDWEVEEFNASALQGDVSISVEAGTGAPKSQLLERLYVKEVLQLGLINVNDPREKMLVLEKYGMKHLATVLDRDMKDAYEEEDLFVKTGSPAALRFNDMLDNHIVHFAIHRDFIKGDKFKQLNDVMRQAILQHARKHFMMLQQPTTQPQPVKIPMESGKPKSEVL